jgi:aconitase B
MLALCLASLIGILLRLECAQVLQQWRINLDDIKEPILACPNDPDDVKLLSEVANTKIDEVFIGSCMTKTTVALSLTRA